MRFSNCLHRLKPLFWEMWTVWNETTVIQVLSCQQCSGISLENYARMREPVPYTSSWPFLMSLSFFCPDYVFITLFMLFTLTPLLTLLYHHIFYVCPSLSFIIIAPGRIEVLERFKRKDIQKGTYNCIINLPQVSVE